MINLVVALMVEARPLVAAFGLREDPRTRGFRVYAGDAVRLVVTGVGKMNAAAAVAYLYQFGSAQDDEVWINVGIAGHRDLPIGTGVHAVRVVDAATGRAWYPPQAIPIPGPAAVVVTADRPVDEFDTDHVYEMEAAGFYSSAVRFATGELVQCYKVISDNEREVAENVTRTSAQKLIGDHITALRRMVDDLGALRETLPVEDRKREEMERFLHRWHFTVSQTHQLRDLLRRWHARTQESVWNSDLNRSPSAKAAMARIAQRLDELAVL